MYVKSVFENFWTSEGQLKSMDTFSAYRDKACKGFMERFLYLRYLKRNKAFYINIEYVQLGRIAQMRKQVLHSYCTCLARTWNGLQLLWMLFPLKLLVGKTQHLEIACLFDPLMAM